LRKRKFILGAIFILIAVVFFLSYQLLHSAVISGILPTQTSIFTGPTVDSTLIAELQKPQWDGKINRVQAIGLAELYCAYANSLPKEYPSNIESSLMTEKEAQYQLKGDASGFSDKPVWLVSMDGLWEHEGPVTENGTVVPLLFSHCDVIIDAKSGEMSSLRNLSQQ
jgi:hypothetical protein